MEGFPHLRKAHCMFGWDWGQRLPDAGIFRDVSLLGIKKDRLESVYISQIHEVEKVTLDFDIALENFEKNEMVKITVTDPEGQKIAVEEKNTPCCRSWFFDRRTCTRG